MTPLALAASAAFGVVGGLLAGLVGIGGGAVLVPFLYVLLARPEWSGLVVSAEAGTVLAHATSLAVIVPTAVSAVRSFDRAGLVPWRIVLPMGATAVLGALAGTRLAPLMPGEALRGGFAVFLGFVGLRLLADRRRERPGSTDTLRHPWLGAVGGLVVGVFSALLGVGGGLVAIPILIYGFGLELHRVAAASIAVVAFAALAGTAGYLVASPGLELPRQTVGWVLWPAALALAPGAVVGARWGAGLNQRLDVRWLRRLFSVLLLVLAARIGLAVLLGPTPSETRPVPPSSVPA